jgi:hypothetical protein
MNTAKSTDGRPQTNAGKSFIPTVSLQAIGSQANREHQLATDAACNALEHAMRCGELLSQAKAELGHGNFLPWLKANFAGSERTAQSYMRLASNPQRVADLGCDSIRDAVEALTDRRSALEKAAEALEKLAALPVEEAAKLSDRDFEMPFHLLKESLETIDIDAMTSVPELAELIRLLERAINAGRAVTLDCERIVGQILTTRDAIGNATREKPDHPLSETDIAEILRAVGIDWSALKAIIAAVVKRNR